MDGGWQRVTARQWALPDDQGMALRVINVRDPRIGEPDGAKFVVSGDGHGESVHSSFDAAKAAAEASLDAS